jgi:hypothetical protein
LNTWKTNCVTILSVCNSIACKPSYVCYYYCCKCYSKCCICCGLAMVSIQSLYTFASKFKYFLPFENLVSCSFLTS